MSDDTIVDDGGRAVEAGGEGDEPEEGAREGASTGIGIGHAAAVVAGGVLLGAYAAWMTVDVGLPRWLSFALVGGGTAYLLWDEEGVRRQAVQAVYVLALLLVLTPVTMVLPDVASAAEYGVSPVGLAFTGANALLFVVFLVPALVLAYVAYRADGGAGVVRRVRG